MYAVDIQPLALETVKRKMQQQGLRNIVWVAGDVERLERLRSLGE